MPSTTKKPGVKKTGTRTTTTRKPRTASTRTTKPRSVKKEKETAAPVAAAPETAEETKVIIPKSAAGQNFYAVGKRKTSVAQVIMTLGNGTVTVNDLPFEQYFPTELLRSIVMNPLTTLGLEKSINLRAKVHGGGIHAQAEALRHALSRALTVFNPEVRRTLKKQGFLTRDPRVKERKKPGLKRARRAPQFSKR